MPRLSILLPYRNAAATLAECLADLRAQHCDDYELLAVNDHSTDASVELMRGRTG
ncbi:MAG: glycosyltransferase family 2 protein [Gammaproteobacteria bacterium]